MMTSDVLPILVDASRDADHVDVLRAVGCASALAFDPQSDVWSRWYAGSQTKSVRVAQTQAQQARALEALPHVSSRVDNVTAHAFTPMDIAAHREIKKSRVAGFQRDVIRTESHPDDPKALVYVASDLGMSTGKAAAQAAHAFCGLTGRVDPSRVGVIWCPSSQFPIDPLITIRDNGLTEIKPGSLTAVAVLV